MNHMRWFNKSKKIALPYPDVYISLSRIRIDVLEHLLLSVSTQLLTERQELENKIKRTKSNDFDNEMTYQWYIDDLSDTFHTLKDIEKEAEKLSIIGLYRIVESNTISIFKRLYGNDKKRLKKLHKFDEQKKHLVRDFHVDLEKILNYEKINELRLLNNAIKHNNSIVTQELAKYDGWKENEEMSDYLNLFNEFSSAIPQYLKNLADQINKAVQIKCKKSNHD